MFQSMATKGERFRADAQKAAHFATPPDPAGHEPAGKIAARHGRSKDRIRNSASHNEALTHSAQSSYEFEVSRNTPRPSRKSTRKALNRNKTDSGLRLTQMNRNAAAKARAGRRSGNPT